MAKKKRKSEQVIYDSYEKKLKKFLSNQFCIDEKKVISLINEVKLNRHTTPDGFYNAVLRTAYDRYL